MPAIGIICRAGAFGGNHRRAQRMVGCAFFAKRRTIVRFLDTFQHQAADAKRRFSRVDFFNFKKPFRIVFATAFLLLALQVLVEVIKTARMLRVDKAGA